MASEDRKGVSVVRWIGVAKFILWEHGVRRVGCEHWTWDGGSGGILKEGDPRPKAEKGVCAGS